MRKRILLHRVRDQHDVVFVRRRAKELAALLGLEYQDQVRVATAVSEIARNAFEYGGGGEAEFAVLADPARKLEIVIRDRGRGIADLDRILDGDYESETGMGVGMRGARRLVDEFIVARESGGTSVTLRKSIRGKGAISAPELLEIVDRLAIALPADPLAEVREQNGELVRALGELESRQSELVELNAELEATNRGVVALYAELDEKAEAIRRASQLKTRFLSNLTHEFRTPLGSILSLGDLLLDGIEGPLEPAQTKVVGLITKSSRELLELVNDLLDLAKVEAGKIPVRVSEFELDDLFETLRGLLRPIADRNAAVALRFVDPAKAEGKIRLRTDEGKVTQILRNLVSNALKYTEAGEVVVEARSPSATGSATLEFSVRDTGIGIRAEDLSRIFEEFVQVENPLQSRNKGTGLGLSLTQRLVELLGGTIRVRSALGEGSTFVVELPLRYAGPETAEYLAESGGRGARSASGIGAAPPADSTAVPIAGSTGAAERIRVLIVDDEPSERAFLEQALLSYYDVEVRSAGGGREGIDLAFDEPPDLIFLDLNMPDVDGFEVLQRLKGDARTSGVPVVLHTAKRLGASDELRLNGHAGILAKSDGNEERFLTRLRELLGRLSLRERG